MIEILPQSDAPMLDPRGAFWDFYDRLMGKALSYQDPRNLRYVYLIEDCFFRCKYLF